MKCIIHLIGGNVSVLIFNSLQECSNFQAGDKVRAKVINKKLDVTGAFGSMCKHEIPLLFLDMRHGERYAYLWWFGDLLSG